jgi:hypothetical protein
MPPRFLLAYEPHMSLVLKRASASRPPGQWKDEDYDVLADGTVVGRIYDDGSSVRRRSCDRSGRSPRSGQRPRA